MKTFLYVTKFLQHTNIPKITINSSNNYKYLYKISMSQSIHETTVIHYQSHRKMHDNIRR